MNKQQFIDSLRELLEDYEDTIEYNSTPATQAPATPKLLGTLRGGTLHLQYGTQGSYQKADVELTGRDVIRLQQALSGPNTTTSLAGSQTRYIVGTLNQDGTVNVGGVVVNNPFWSKDATPTSRPSHFRGF